MASSSCATVTAINSRGAMDSRKKLKKIRSRKYSGIRLSKSSVRRVKTAVLDSSTYDLSSSNASSVNQSSFEFPSASPDFMTAIKEGGDEINEAESGVVKESASSRNYLKGTSSSDGKKNRSQASIRSSSNDGDMETKSQTPTTSSRNLGFLMTKSSFKYRKTAKKNVNRNTCSSSLKDCKFPHTIELQTGERESIITPIMKVCPYTYCSLHGHHHKPPLPRFRRVLSKSRRTIRYQKSMKFRCQSSLRREQCIDDLLKEIDTIDGDPIVQETSTECSDFSGTEDHGSEVKNAEQADLHIVASREIEEDDNLDTIVEQDRISEFSSMEMHNAPFHNLKNDTKTRTDSQDDDFSAAEEEGVEPNHVSDFLSTEMDNAPFYNLENATKTREHEEQNDLQVDDSSITEEEGDANIISEPTRNSEFLSIEMHNSPPLHNLNNASKTRQHEGSFSMEIPCPPNSKEEIVKHDCESNETIEVSNTPLSRRNHVSMWHLINQHMVLGMPPSDENPKTEDHEIEDHKIHAVKLVREAIEKILLPEVQDDQSSVCSDITTDQGELMGENCSVAAPKGNKSEKTAIKNWSNLKKWVLLKRFIKELEKVKRLNIPRQPSLPSGIESDGEKVNLRHQTKDVKKKTEEWMLDYALRKVVSELAPTQQRKVALLVKAFETVGPTPEEGLQIKSLSFRDNGDRNLNAESVGQQNHQDEANIVSTEPTIPDKVKIHKPLSDDGKLRTDDSCITSFASSPRSSTSTSLDYEKEVEEKDGEIMHPGEVESEKRSLDSNTLREVFNRKLNETKGLGMWHLIHQNMVQGLHHKKASSIRDDNDNASRVSSDDYYSDERLDIEEHKRKSTTIKLVREAIENILLPAEFQDHQETVEITPVATTMEDNIEEKSSKKEPKNWSSLKKMILLKRFIKELAKVKKTIKRETDGKEEELQLRDKRNSEEWMVDFALRQVVSELAPVQKRKVALLVKAFETVAPPSEELNLQIAASPKTKKPINNESGSDHSFKLISEREQQQRTQKKKSSLNLKSKLANEKPIDKRQYISMWHQLCQHVVSGQMEYEEGEGDKSEFKQSDAVRIVREAISEIMSQSDASDTQSTSSEQEEERQRQRQSDDGFDKHMAQAVKMSKSESEGPRKWSKVRKLMILKRSIKAMENARKVYSQRPPQFLPLKPEIQAEKIDLKQQMMEERKKAEDWMLDYALQNIVTKLTPARKRRVSMLVEAFEAVVPLPSF